MLGRGMAARTPKLYVLPGSHPCAAVEAALALKSIAYTRVDLLPFSQLLIGPLRFGGTTVPGMRLEDERLVGSRPIMRRLDALAPEPPLLPPPGSPTYARVLEAERWGDEVFQGVATAAHDRGVRPQPGIARELRRRRQAAAAESRVATDPAGGVAADGQTEAGAGSGGARRPGCAPTPARSDRRLDRRGSARRRAPERRRPADRQLDPPADEHRRPPCAPRRPAPRPS